MCLDGPDALGVEAEGVTFIAQLDVDGDGALDLAWPTGSGLAVSVATADGFGAAQERPFDATAVFAGDADGDGVDELLVRDATGAAALWRPDLQGGFALVETIDTSPLTGLSAAVLHPAIGVVGARGEDVVRVDAEGQAWDLDVGASIEQMVLSVSFDGDASPDVFVRTDDYTLVGVRTTAMGLEAMGPVPIPVSTQHIEPARWNADGLGDLVLLLDDGTVLVWLSDGTGGFVDGPSSAVPRSSTGLRVVDLTDDTQPDVLAFGSEPGLALAVRRGSELDADVRIDDGGPWLWVAPVRVGVDPFEDLLLYDGAGFSALRRDP